MENPLNKFDLWFKSQNRTIVEDLSFLISVMNPSFDLIKNNSSISSKEDGVLTYFYDVIQNYMNEEPTNIGFILALRANIDFLLTSRCSENSWKKAEELHNIIIDSDKSTENMNNLSTKKIEELPELKKEWNNFSLLWENFKKEIFSDTNINSWQDHTMHERIK
ncbi:hypothetical protein N5U05_07725 [Aliarcobacter butzleri]|uniref:hypothetical protein n=1 Tax=Aliarcobacter butzleri TaxID=28197 RepID=UPI0021B38099|nr:hypothetical protein [Aliarcobacter butzleri]MCT7617628.1 hypothetical protein [Aliarcobacter butzleri]